jgi:phospholipid transport system transporter-binding protein
MKLPPTLTLDDAAAALEALPADGGAQRVDAAGLRDFDSSALALLLEAKRRAQARGQAFEVRDAPVKLRQLARLYGVAELLGL